MLSRSGFIGSSSLDLLYSRIFAPAGGKALGIAFWQKSHNPHVVWGTTCNCEADIALLRLAFGCTKFLTESIIWTVVCCALLPHECR